MNPIALQDTCGASKDAAVVDLTGSEDRDRDRARTCARTAEISAGARQSAKARRVEVAASLPPELQGLLADCGRLPPVDPRAQAKLAKKPAAAVVEAEGARPAKPQLRRSGASEALGEEEEEEEAEEKEEDEAPSMRKRPAAASTAVMPPDMPKAAGECPAGQKSWVQCGPNGGKVQIILDTRVFYVKSAEPGQRQVTWSKHGGVVAAWAVAAELAGF